LNPPVLSEGEIPVDPQKAWKDLAKAFEQDDWHAAGLIADDLIGWLAKGG